jgi:nicotinamide mononucleotide (NMN) deamidase PncC
MTSNPERQRSQAERQMLNALCEPLRAAESSADSYGTIASVVAAVSGFAVIFSGGNLFFVNDQKKIKILWISLAISAVLLLTGIVVAVIFSRKASQIKKSLNAKCPEDWLEPSTRNPPLSS